MLNISESESESESGSESDSSGNSRTILTYHSETIFLTTICTSVNRRRPVWGRLLFCFRSPTISIVFRLRTYCKSYIFEYIVIIFSLIYSVRTKTKT